MTVHAEKPNLHNARLGEFTNTLEGYGYNTDFDHGYQHTSLWYVSLLGPAQSVRAAWIRLVKGQECAISTGGTYFNLYGYLSKHVDKKGWKWRERHLPASGSTHGLLLPEDALYNGTGPHFLLFPMTEDVATLHYQYLNRRVDVPLHASWAPWLWQRALDEREAEQLKGTGSMCYLCKPNAGLLKKQLERAIQFGQLGVPRG